MPYTNDDGRQVPSGSPAAGNRFARTDRLEPVRPGQMPARRTGGAHMASSGRQAPVSQAPVDQTPASATTQMPGRTPLPQQRGTAPANTAYMPRSAYSAAGQDTYAGPARTTVMGARGTDNRGGTDPQLVPPVDLYSAHRCDNDDETPRNHRALKIGLGVAAGLLVAGYIGGIVAFSNLYYPGTSIAGVDVSLTDAGTAAERIESTVADYSLTVSGLGFECAYTPEAGTFAVDAQQEATTVLSANEAIIWPVKLISSLTGGGQSNDETASNLTATYDKKALEAAVGAAVDQFNADRPGTFDAAGAYDEEEGKFTVARARANQKLSRDAVIAAAEDAISHAQATAELDDSMYEELAGGATDEQLQAACDAANEIIGVNVDLTMGGKTVATLDGKTMTQWITFDEDLNPTLQKDGLSKWIRQLAEAQLDTVGTERRYTRPDGKEVDVSGGEYGWISNEAELAELIQAAVKNKQTGEIEIPTKQEAAQYNGAGGRDWGAYVDIDISEQHVRYYSADDELLWESGCITGNPNENNDTPTGIYSINNLERDVQLTGKRDPETGEPEYISYVDYWMSFIGGAVGLHDADWQASSSFSDPTAYTWTGSHGCVNLPPSKAAELFDLLSIGDCVIVHY